MIFKDNMRTIVERFINTLCIDNRITNGIFSIENDLHMDILEEYLVKYGVSVNEAMEVRNKVVEGRFPDRQAYNKNGILVTFPNPDYKKRALERGTHFEQDPTKQSPNIYGNQPAQPQSPAVTPSAPPSTQPPPTSQPSSSPPAEKKQEEPSKLQPATSEPASPPSTEPTAPVSTNPAKQPSQPPVETTPAEPVSGEQLPPPAVAVPPTKKPKTPEQKRAEEEYVEKLLTTELQR